ncbi:hypothetical protein SCHPADRAFT_1001246 [Schizopora paradoxa]|uniref:F-box domain-containing protein n=1 Tax=Schizopora paradoxa TaxID=27342 RepID=A0A0H2RER6_9AGAM|nr:hypothetical protein SCHPADRAFT_1001246 [Schizopora paradoxa]
MARGWICLTDSKPESETSFASLVDALGKLERAWMEHGDGKDTWCTDWLRVSEDSDTTTELKVQVAKSSLQRMKSITKVLASMLASLEESIDFVTEQSLNVVRSHGFSSLPDEIIARIFELYHEGYAAPIGECPSLGWGKSFRASNVLAQVNRHTRRIALHLPALWEYVPLKTRHFKEMVANLNKRCQNPNIFINYTIFHKVNTSTSACADFLRLLHPASQWKGLNIIHRSGGPTCYGDVSTISSGKLDGLLDLRIYHHGEPWIPRMRPDEPSTNLSKHELALLSGWRLPALNRLTLIHVIPARMDCPNIRECHIALDYTRKNWDLFALRDFFGCIPQLESLSFSFHGVNIDTDSVYRLSASITPVSLSRLEMLAMNITGATEDAFLQCLLNLLDVSTISSLKISLTYKPNYAEPDDDRGNKWLKVIFNDERRHAFPNVTEFWLSIRKGSVEYFPSHGYVMQFVPHVKSLVLDLPSCTEPSFLRIFESLGELQTVRLHGCDLFEGDWIVRDLERVNQQKLAQIESFDIGGSLGLLKYKDDLERVLGRKLVWKA